MATFTATYGFASSLAPVVSDPALTASALTKPAAATSLSASGGVATGQTGIIAASSFPSDYVNRSYYIDVAPTAGGSYTLGNLSLRARCTVASASSLAVRSSVDSYAANVPGMTTVTLPSSLTSYGPWDLSSLGTLTGTTRIIFMAYSSSNTSRTYELDDIVLEVVFTPPAAQTLSPSSLGSSLAFGAPGVTETTPVLLGPYGVASGATVGSATLGETSFVPLPTGADVDAFLGGVGVAEVAAYHVGVISALARAYTRGNGFFGTVCDPDLWAVIVSASARLTANPEQTRTTVGNTSIHTAFVGWNLAERAVLNGYRGVAR